MARRNVAFEDLSDFEEKPIESIDRLHRGQSWAGAGAWPGGRGPLLSPNRAPSIHYRAPQLIGIAISIPKFIQDLLPKKMFDVLP